jgi:hypothetical protein
MSQFLRTAVAVGVGGVAAGFMAPVVAGWGAGVIITNVATGIIGTTCSIITNNMIADQPLEVQYRPQEAQQAFRNAISSFINTELDPILRSIQRNCDREFGTTLVIQLVGGLEVLDCVTQNGTKVLFEYKFKVRRRPGTFERNLEEGVPPPELPNFDNPAETDTYSLPPGMAHKTRPVLEGLGWSIVKGGAVGFVGAGLTLMGVPPGFSFIQTAPSGIGVLVGLPTAVGAGASATEFSREASDIHKIACYVNFAAELRCHINRVVECAALNGVELQYHVKAGVGRVVAGQAPVPGTDQNARGVVWDQFWYEATQL